MRKKIKWRIKPRIFLMILLLLIGVFCAVFLAFNIFINSYIVTNVKSQLSELATNFSRHDAEEEQEQSELPNIKDGSKSKIGMQGGIFLLNSSYEVEKYYASLDENELIQIAKELKAENIKFEKIDRLFIETDLGDYYISCVKDEKEESAVFVFFVNVTSIVTLVDTINTALGAIMIVMLLISFFIANLIAGSITKPVRKLAEFATQLGKSDFSANNYSFIDIEFNELSAEMNKTAEKLDQSDTEQRTFFQNVSHELRTPLMSIKCHAEGIEHNLMDKENSSRIIISETDRLSEMVEDLLYISRIEKEKKPAMQENDLRETLSFCAETLKPVADKNGKQFVFDFDDAPTTLSYNEKHMTRACLNLIANALHYAKTTVTLSCKTVNGSVIIEVIDDGNGISGADLPHIFERFYKGKDGKYGIGLSIVKLIVGMHRGEIYVSSDEATKFKMVFPV